MLFVLKFYLEKRLKKGIMKIIYKSEIPRKILLNIPLSGVNVNILKSKIYALKTAPSPFLIVEKIVEKAKRTMSL